MKIVWRVSEKNDTFIKLLGEKERLPKLFSTPQNQKKSRKLAVLLPITFFSTNREQLTGAYPRSLTVVAAFTRKNKVCRNGHVMYPRNHKKWEPLCKAVHLRGVRRWIWEIWNINRKVGRKSYGRFYEEVEKSRNKSVFWPFLCLFWLRGSHPSHTNLMFFHTRGTLRVCRITLQCFMEIVWRVFEKTDTFIKLLLEKERLPKLFFGSLKFKIEKSQKWLCYFQSHIFQQTGGGSLGPIPAR